MAFKIHNANCLDVLRQMPDNSVDAVVTDPPYGLSFMGKKWDYDVPSVEIWAECLRVLKPGGHLLAFAGTRTQHRMAVHIEDAGFEIRDMIAWVYGSGFPKSLDVSKAIDKHGGVSVAWFGAWFRAWREENGVKQKDVAALFPSKTGGLTGCVANWELGFNMPTPEQFNLIRDTFGLPFESLAAAARAVIGSQTKARSTAGASALPTMGGETVYQTWDITAPATKAARQWAGWGTALKPALEPITVARKPLAGTVAANVLAHGTGALNIDGCRVVTTDVWAPSTRGASDSIGTFKTAERTTAQHAAGRWPANLIHDGSDEVADVFGDPARFFYCAKASKKDRDGGLDGLPLRPAGSLNMRTDSHAERNGASTTPRANNHPTVKPTDLMRYLCRLVTPPGGTVLDPFTGSGSTGKAAMLEGFRFIGCEMSAEYAAIAEARVSAALDDYICRL